MTPLDTAHFRANADRLRRHPKLQSGAAPVVRTLAFTGEHDSLTTPERCRAVAARFRDAECFVVRRADHPVPLERPRACAGLVDAFLRGLRV
ncbi:MAG: alpha/beta hydrolase, partial [Planctomycetota bacterium]